jgi:hypothetical protein
MSPDPFDCRDVPNSGWNFTLTLGVGNVGFGAPDLSGLLAGLQQDALAARLTSVVDFNAAGFDASRVSSLPTAQRQELQRRIDVFDSSQQQLNRLRNLGVSGKSLAVLQTQVSHARDNIIFALDNSLRGVAQNEIPLNAADERVSVGGAFASGLTTGGKAVGNAAASGLSLGFYDGPFEVTQQDIYNGYNTSRLIAGASTEFLVGVGTGGLSRYGAVGKAALAFDATSNALGVGRGATDAYKNGLGVGNSIQIVGGAFGLSGNAAGFREASIRNSIDQYIGGLSSRQTPSRTAADLFEIKHTGPTNYAATGGDKIVNIDGFSYRHRAITETKYVGSPATSPYVPGSSIPDAVRRSILGKTRNEFEQLGAVIADPSTPFNSVRVITNTSASQTYFRSLLNEVGVAGTVIRR